jgi:hypothetical protein
MQGRRLYFGFVLLKLGFSPLGLHSSQQLSLADW